MARKPSFKVTQTKRGWKVEKPGSLTSTGERERFYFKTRKLAENFSAKLKTDVKAHGANALTIRPALAEEAHYAEETLKPYGLTISDAVRMVVKIEEAKIASMDVETALANFLLTKEEKSDWQTRAYDQMRAAFVMEFAGRQLSTITPAELVAHVENCTGTNSTFNSRATSIKTFWRWCSKLPRNWCDIQTIEVLEKRETRKGKIEVLTAEQCKALLQTAEEHYPECVPAFAISLFTGMRNAELERLTPKDITPEGITLSKESTKTEKRRFIEMPPVLAAWLKAHPIADTVLPANWFRKEKAVRRVAGWRVWCDLFDPPKAPSDLPDWPDNGIRHTHASVMVALGKPLEALTFEFGHSGGASVLKSHYVGLMTKAEAINIWTIGPNDTVIPFTPEVPSPFTKQPPAPAAEETTN